VVTQSLMFATRLGASRAIAHQYVVDDYWFLGSAATYLPALGMPAKA
jgi:hypothetical protein